MKQSMTYDSNLLLTPSQPVSAFGSLSVPELKLQRTSPTSSVTLDGQFKFAEYFNHSSLDTNGQIVNLQAEKDVSERSTLNLNADFNRDTTLESDQDITGRFLNRPVRFITWDVAPSWTYLLSPIDTVNWQASYQSTSYDSQLKTDYRYYGTTADYTHQLSELTAITGSLSYFRFQPNDTLNTATDIYGGLIGYQYKPTERFKVSGSVGMDYNVTRQNHVGPGTGNNSQLDYRFKFDLSYALSDQTRAELLLSHDSEPSGDAAQVTRNRATFNVSYKVSPLTTFNLATNYADDQDYFGTGSGSQTSQGLSRYFSIGPSIVWNITNYMDLSGSYQFRHKFATGASATDNAALVTLHIALPDQNWSGF